MNGFPHDNKARGVYVGAVGGLPLFSSDTKFDSGAALLPLARPVRVDWLSCEASMLTLFAASGQKPKSIKVGRHIQQPCYIALMQVPGETHEQRTWSCASGGCLWQAV